MIDKRIEIEYTMWGFNFTITEVDGSIFVKGSMYHTNKPEGGAKLAIYKACEQSSFTRTYFMTDSHGRIVL